MSFNLKETTWRIDVWRGGVKPYWFWVTGNKREALKDATETFRGLKQKCLRQKGSLYRDGKAEWVHPAFGSYSEVRITKWN